VGFVPVALVPQIDKKRFIEIEYANFSAEMFTGLVPE